MAREDKWSRLSTDDYQGVKEGALPPDYSWLRRDDARRARVYALQKPTAKASGGARVLPLRGTCLKEEKMEKVKLASPGHILSSGGPLRVP